MSRVSNEIVNTAARRRGQPLVVLMALLLGWTGARVTSLGEEGGLSLPEAVLTVGTATAAQPDPPGGFSRAGPQSYAAPGFAYVPVGAYGPSVQYVPVYAGPMHQRMGVGPYNGARGRAVAFADGTEPEPWSAGFSGDSPLPPRRDDDGVTASGLPPLRSAPATGRYGEAIALLGGRLGRLIGNPGRWSMDAWALVRDDKGATPEAGTLPATYGASQAGAVLRYRLAMASGHKPSAYFRTTSTLGSLNETSAALGLAARPFPSIPIVGAIEARVVDQSGNRRVQPAALAVTEIPPLSLPGALRAELYAQAGYVGGRYATPFADGQVRVDRSLLTLGRAEARLGGGAWGGIQEGASRLDAGPGLVVSTPLSPKVFGRLAVDWRFRVAGNAEPGSGPAMTVAAGF
jgi:hypothetical protein